MFKIQNFIKKFFKKTSVKKRSGMINFNERFDRWDKMSNGGLYKGVLRHFYISLDRNAAKL